MEDNVKKTFLNEAYMLNTLSLAFMGDAVYEIMVRKEIIKNNPNLPAAKLHMMAVETVKACSQSKAYDYIKSKLSDKDLMIMKRGRNSNSTHYPKNSNPIEYHKATGLETLFGYWFLNEEYDKLNLVFSDIYNFLENLNNEVED